MCVFCSVKNVGGGQTLHPLLKCTPVLFFFQGHLAVAGSLVDPLLFQPLRLTRPSDYYYTFNILQS